MDGVKGSDYEDERDYKKCKGCSYFLPEATGNQGVCRRNPPTLTITLIPTQKKFTQEVQLSSRFDSGWPLVKAEQWCGEWKAMIEVRI